MTPSADQYRPGQPVFIHVPKTGGMSVRLIFGSRIWAHGHEPAREVRWMLGERFDSAWSFGFVRNPWDRAVSWYYYSRREDIDQGREPLYTGTELKDHFAKWCRSRAWLCFEPEIRSARKMLTDWETGRILVSQIFRFERFDEAIGTIRSRLGFEHERVAHENRNTWKPAGLTTHDHFNDSSREYIGRLGSWEIQTFGYRF